MIFTLWVAVDRLHQRSGLQPPGTTAEATDMQPDLQRQVAERPGDAHSQYLLGQAQFKLGHFAEAEKAFRAADRAAPNDANTLNGLGWTLLREGQTAQAIPYLRRAATLDSTITNAWYGLGWAYAAVDDFPAARPAYANAVRVDSANTQIGLEYAALLDRIGDDRLALAQIQRVLLHDSTTASVQAFAGYMYRSQGQFRESRDHLRLATKLAPQDAGAWAELAVTEFLMDDSASAVRDFANSARVDSTYMHRRPAYQKMQRAAGHARSH